MPTAAQMAGTMHPISSTTPNGYPAAFGFACLNKGAPKHQEAPRFGVVVSGTPVIGQVAVNPAAG